VVESTREDCICCNSDSVRNRANYLWTGVSSAKAPLTKKPRVYVEARDAPPQNSQLYGASTGTTPRKEISKEWGTQCTETELTDDKDSADCTVQLVDGRVILFNKKKKMLFQSSSPLSSRSRMNELGMRDACNALREREGLPVPHKPSDK